MNPSERASHPSRAQIESLLDFLERNPRLAKGFSKVPSARDANRKTWEKIAMQLNSLGGCVKTWKQWTKYWADKKSAVKRKGALRFQSRNKTGGGAEVVELSQIEERILAIMGGESFAIGDRHLGLLNPFGESAQLNQTVGPQDSPSLLNNQSMGPECTATVPQKTMEQCTTPRLASSDVLELDIPEAEALHVRQYVECVPGTSHLSARPSVVRLVSQSPQPRARSPPCTPPLIGSSAIPIQASTPSGSGRHPRMCSLYDNPTTSGSPTQHRSLPTNMTSTRLRHRSRRVRSPPTQRQSHFTNLTERFLELEQQRIEVDLRNSQILERLVNREEERDRSMAQALMVIGEAIKLLAEAVQNK